MTQIDIEERRAILELIATLANLKSEMVDRILRPAGVRPDVYRALLSRRDEVTGRLISKRQIGALVLDALSVDPEGPAIARRVLEIGSSWSSFHLAHNEYEARAAVQKAREVLGRLDMQSQQEDEQRAAAHADLVRRVEQERASIVARQSELLLQMFDEASISDDRQRRGYLLQELLNRLFDAYGIPVFRSFQRNDGAEQVDGAFRLDSWFYLVECRWRRKPADVRDLDGLLAQVERSGHQSMGLFLSIYGFSQNVPAVLKQNVRKSIVLMDGHVLRTILTQEIDLEDYLKGSLAHLNLDGEPMLSVSDYRRLASSRVVL